MARLSETQLQKRGAREIGENDTFKLWKLEASLDSGIYQNYYLHRKGTTRGKRKRAWWLTWDGICVVGRDAPVLEKYDPETFEWVGDRIWEFDQNRITEKGVRYV